MAFQVFVSYARLDDIPPPGGHEGFVTMLVRQLEWDLKQRKPTPTLWRDKDGRIRASDQFDGVIQKGIEESSVLLVILSDNWLDREWCRKELKLFADVHGADAARDRIIVAAKHDMKPADRPPLLQGQTGYKFYDEEARDKPEFFMRGKSYESQLLLVVEDLATDIRERVLTIDPTSRLQEPAPRPSRGGGKRVYLAKPANDMKLAYNRLFDELQESGHTLGPALSTEIPLDSTAAATAFVDEALQDADVAIHLIGELPGRATDDRVPIPIVKLQLARSAARAGNGEGSLHRIIWAPKIVANEHGSDPQTERDPLAVLREFGDQLDDDQIDGGELSKFRDYLVQHLSKRVTRDGLLEELGADSRVYVYYRKEDEDYALEIANTLRQRNIQPLDPVFDGTDAEVSAWHRKRLAECDAVVVCWADAGEVWVRQQTPEWKDWRKLGREKKFACRGVIAGPPGDRKQSYMKKHNMKLLPPDEVDVVLDLTGYRVPPPEALDPLFG